jgi:hypothetical protein
VGVTGGRIGRIYLFYLMESLEASQPARWTRADGRVLVELSREAMSGAWRLWVAGDRLKSGGESIRCV